MSCGHLLKNFDKDKEMNSMNAKEFVISKKTVYITALTLVILAVFLLFGGKLSIPSFSHKVTDTELVDGSSEKFAVLSSHGAQGGVGST